MRKLTHEEIIALREKNRGAVRNPITILLNDIRSLYNVGAIFRIADGIRAEKVFLCGITGAPPDPQITKTALGAENSVPWDYNVDANLIAGRLKDNGYQLVALEHTDQASDYLQAQFKFPICLIVGNEVSGVDPNLVSIADLAIQIPMFGVKNSLNVSVAAGIVLYHALNSLHVK